MNEVMTPLNAKLHDMIETPPVIDTGGSISRSVIEAALSRWQEQRRQLELSIVATNTVIAELIALIAPVPEKVPTPPEDKP